MKLFVAYLVLCFVGGMLLAGRKDALRVWILLGLVSLVLIGYYFFHQI